MQIAQTILNQLGGNKFLAMTGAKNLVAEEKGLFFKLPRAANGINAVKITLNAMDTYDMKFYSIRGVNVNVKEELAGVYCDGLESSFTETTGLYTRLN